MAEHDPSNTTEAEPASQRDAREREFEAWLKAHGYRVAPNLWESYVYGPESTANPAQWRTEFTRPLMD